MPNEATMIVKGDKLSIENNNIVISRKNEIIAIIPSNYVIVKFTNYEI